MAKMRNSVISTRVCDFSFVSIFVEINFLNLVRSLQNWFLASYIKIFLSSEWLISFCSLYVCNSQNLMEAEHQRAFIIPKTQWNLISTSNNLYIYPKPFSFNVSCSQTLQLLLIYFHLWLIFFFFTNLKFGIPFVNFFSSFLYNIFNFLYLSHFIFPDFLLFFILF